MSSGGGSALRAEARVDLAALQANLAILRAKAPSSALMAVVKADAYGHGLIPCAKAAVAGGADWLGVALLSEALTLRAAGVTAPVLAWLYVPGDRDLVPAVAAGIDLGAYAPWAIDEIAAAARAAGRTARVHLKVDTGLSRGGAADWPALVDSAAKAEAEGAVRVIGIYSHLASADEPANPLTAAQTERFTAALAYATDSQRGRAGLRPEVCHLANSAGTLAHPATHFDLVRCGIAMYGLAPGPDLGTAADLGLTPVMTLVSQLALVKRVPAGSGMGYGHAYVTERDTTVGLIPLGYADGIPRNATNVGPVFAAGRRRKIAGRVSMDQIIVDLGDDSASAGDEVVLFGAGHNQNSAVPTVDDWAQATGTINYEIVTRLGPRVVRTYGGGG